MSLVPTHLKMYDLAELKHACLSYTLLSMKVTELEYLDKIIHIPFCLPRKSKRDQKNYLDALLNGEDNSCTMTLRRLRGERVSILAIVWMGLLTTL